MNWKVQSETESQADGKEKTLLASAREQRLINELRAAFRKLPNAMSSIQSEKRWQDNIELLQESVIAGDPRRFLQWDVIKRTMEVGNADFIEVELNFLKASSNWSRWQRALLEVPVGEPTASIIYPASSGNLIHHAYHVSQVEDKAKLNIENLDCIFEFGGGYGGMYKLIHNLGFEGKYVIFDLPAFSALQRYFIKCSGLKVHSMKSFQSAQSGVICISDLRQLEILLSKYMPAENGMFIATWSLSECPISFRKKILDLLSQFRIFLIAYQGRFEGSNNIEFFDNWKKSKQQYNWDNYKIEHIPNNFYGDNYYLVGWNTH